MLREPVLSGPYGVRMLVRTCRSGDCAQKMGLPSPVKNYILYIGPTTGIASCSSVFSSTV